MAEKIQCLDESAKFNKQVCEGVLSIKNGNFSSALDFFAGAILLFPDSKEGYIYRFLTYVAKELSGTDPKYYIISRNNNVVQNKY